MATNPSPRINFDRTPPQNLEAEQSVLGAMLLTSDAMGAAFEILKDKASDVFYSEAHQYIYDALLSLFQQGTPVDAVTLLDQLNRSGRLEESGGASYISELSGRVPTAANIEHYAQIVLDAALMRKLIGTCTVLAGQAYENTSDVDTLLDEAEAAIFLIAEKRQLSPIYKVSELLEDSIHRIEELIKTHTGISGIPTGFAKLDELTSGLQPSDMIVLAARPAVGKTAFALNMAAHVAGKEEKSVLLFSIEMAKEQLVQRLICMEGEINSRRLRTGFLAQSEFPKLTRAADKLSRAPIFIDDTPNITVLELRSKARRHHAVHGLDMIVVDYLQLMSGPSRANNRQEEISIISRSLKGIARELQVPVVALSQLNREADKDDMGTPKLSQLRESGAIEQDADVVIMLSRPPIQDREENQDIINVNIAKQRNGPTGDFQLHFDRNIQRMRDYDAGLSSSPPGGYSPPSGEEENVGGDEGIPF